MSDCFSGEERIEAFAPTGMPMRMGELSGLAVSDKDKVSQLFDEGDPAKLEQYLPAMFQNHTFITMGFLEWCLQCAKTAAACFDSQTERAICQKVFAQWQKEVVTLADDDLSQQVIDTLAELLHPDKVKPDSVDDYRQNMGQGADPRFLQMNAQANADFKAIQEACQQFDFAKAQAIWPSYFRSMQIRHDAMAHYTSSYPAVVQIEHGQTLAEKVMKESFEGCSFHDPMFALITTMSPQDLAAFLADHLRTHFSGSDRGGGIEIEEDEQAYRLRFAPCGSGGALRQRLAQAGQETPTFKEASEFTWNRAGEVPPYCSHCAYNEVFMIDKIGYPAMVTEFDPDPMKPCGWTVFKDPDNIPEEYYQRVGRQKKKT